MSVLQLLQEKFDELDRQIKETKQSISIMKIQEEDLKLEIEKQTSALEEIQSDTKVLEQKLKSMESTESELKGQFQNIVSSASLLLDTMDNTNFEESNTVESEQGDSEEENLGE
jgi:chromosome segregation ATPase